MNTKMKMLTLFLTVVGATIFMMSPALCAEIDVGTNLPASESTPTELEPITQAGDGGMVLWDTSHGVYLYYSPSAGFSSLVSVLAGMGYTVDENSSGVLSVDLNNYDIIVVCWGSAWDSAYSAAEVSAIVDFVNNGGGLLIMGDNPACPNNNINPVAQAFGTTLGLSYVGDITSWSDHPIFAGISGLAPAFGGEVSGSYPSSEEAWGSGGQPMVTVAEPGSGRMVALGDANIFDNTYIPNADNQLFSENIFDWLDRVAQVCDYCLTDTYGYNWCLDVVNTDGMAYYLMGTCDTGTLPLKDAHATYVYNGTRLAMTAHGGATGGVFTYNTKFISATTASGVWINSGGFGGHVNVDLVPCGNGVSIQAESAGPAPTDTK